MSKRLKSGHWLDAYRSRLGAELVPFYVVRKGDYDAGAIFVRVDDRELWTPEYDFAQDKRIWRKVAENEAIAPYVERLERNDPDFWLLDVDKGGEKFLFEEGL